MPANEKDKALIQRLLSDPDLFPDEFKRWLSRQTERNPNVELKGYQINGITDASVAQSAGIARFKTRAQVLAAGLTGGTINLNHTTLGEEPDFFLAAGNGDTLVLPKVDTVPGKFLTIKNVSGNPIAVQPFSGDDVDGDTANINIDRLGDFVELVSGARKVNDGETTWYATNIVPIRGHNLQLNFSISPPANPVDGDLWLFPFDDGEAGAGDGYWLFVYDSSEGTYKWKHVGGPPMARTITTDETITADATFRNPATTGPVITIPRAGYYYVKATAGGFSSGSPGVGNIDIGVIESAGGANIATGQEIQNAGSLVTVTVIRGPFVLGASTTLTLKYAANTATAHFRDRYMEIVPLRIS